MPGYRVGIDFGGTKIELAALALDGSIVLRRRVPTPRCYQGAIAAMCDLIAHAEWVIGERPPVGVGIPGRINPLTGLVHCANCLDGHPVERDLASAIKRPVRVANDAVCFTLSEAAADGAAHGGHVVFGAILGTGCGGGLVVDGMPHVGHNGIAGEWGHSPFPWMAGETIPGRHCWCGQLDCLETVISGRGLAAECDGPAACDAAVIAERARAGDGRAKAAVERHAQHLARALATVVNLLDPDAIVLGGGLSKMEHLYERLPALMPPRVFGRRHTPVLRPAHGDSSGVRGAAWLWSPYRPHEARPALAAHDA